MLGLDVVTADGEQIYCDPENHPDLYWAARGSGPGFFGVVTSFKLRIHPRPAVCGHLPVHVPDRARRRGVHLGALDQFRDRRPSRTANPRHARVSGEPGSTSPAITIASPVFAESEEEAAKALALLGTCPVADKAIDQPSLCADNTWPTGTPP